MAIDTAIVVRAHTRLEELVARHNTQMQSRFYVESRGGNFDDYVAEHDAFYHSFEAILKGLGSRMKTKVIDRGFLPRFLFAENHLVVVVGRDGLVANTAKYVHSLPILAINPDPTRNDGVLLPFLPDTFTHALPALLEGRTYPQRRISMAEAKLNDGQRLLAFNDLFIGPTSHISLRYRIQQGQQAEVHSSSGIIVSTGAGSTGWMSSLFNMARGMVQAFAPQQVEQEGQLGFTLPWETDRLLYVVREPFASRASQASLTAGYIAQGQPLLLESYMPQQGTIFSDGVEHDFLQFNSGTIATIGLAPEQAVLVMAG